MTYDVSSHVGLQDGGPGSSVCARLHRRRDELHSVQTVLDGREQDLAVGPLALPPRADGVSYLRVDGREALEIAFGMAGRDPRHPCRRRPRARASPGEPTRRLAEGRIPQLVGVLLVPLEPALGAEDTQLEPVLVAGRHLAGPQHAARAALETQQDLGVVVEATTCDAARAGRAQR